MKRSTSLQDLHSSLVYVSSGVVIGLSLAVPVAHAEDLAAAPCEARIKKLFAPVTPAMARRTLKKEGNCEVLVTYTLNEKGKPKIVSAEAGEERCKRLEAAAVGGVVSSKFLPGESILTCQRRYEFEFK